MNIKQSAQLLLQNFKNQDSVPYWENVRKKLLQYIIERDINTFLHWDIIQETMYVHRTGYAQTELFEIQNDVKFRNIPDTVQVSPVGSPISWENHAHMIYHLKEYGNKTNNIDYSFNTILEFGGGFGNMAYIYKKLKPNVKYIIFDFPEFNLLQKWFLEQNGIFDVIFISSLEELQQYKNIDLLIATWSLSEAPLDFRKNFLSSIECKNFLFAYQKHFDDSNAFCHIDNDSFFKEMIKLYPGNWIDYKIKHLFGEQYYLFK